MAKECLIEHYGDVRYTIGTGCSGGSIAQQTIANAYPGGLPGAGPHVRVPGRHERRRAVRRLPPAAPVLRGPVEAGARAWRGRRRSGGWSRAGPTRSTPIAADEELFKGAMNPVGDCVPADQAYDPKTRPGGVRCRSSTPINLLGRGRRASGRTWRSSAGHGFAGQPFGNAGIQYGLWRSRARDHARPVRRPQRVGRRRRHRPQPDARLLGRRRRGGQRLPQRHDQRDDAHVRRGDHRPRGSRPGHRARLRAHLVDPRPPRPRAGQPRNEVLWFGPTPLIGSPTWPTEALLSMDRWLASVERDHSTPRAHTRSSTTSRPTCRTAAPPTSASSTSRRATGRRAAWPARTSSTTSSSAA